MDQRRHHRWLREYDGPGIFAPGGRQRKGEMYRTPMPKLIGAGIAATLALLLVACASPTRPAEPPSGKRFRVPEGAMTIQTPSNVPVAPEVISIAEAAINNLLATSSRSEISERFGMGS